jgi:hypothetical protein
MSTLKRWIRNALVVVPTGSGSAVALDIRRGEL